MRPFPGSLAACGKPDGKAWLAGDPLVLPELAATLAGIAATINPDRATPSLELGRDQVAATAGESPETTHYSVVDTAGMAVATTTTLEGSFRCHVVVLGTGFLLNNEIGDLNRKPGATTLRGEIGTPANEIAPGKRMLSSMTPTSVARHGQSVLVTGSPGGRTIINTIMNTIFDEVAGVVALGLDALRFHHQWLPDRLVVEAGGIDPATRVALEALGHEVVEGAAQGSPHSIWFDPATGTATGIPDFRGPDSRAVPAAGTPAR